jgi:amino acid adenylation domain-containing protein
MNQNILNISREGFNTMDLKTFLKNIKAKNIELWIEENDLCYQATDHLSIESELSELKQHKTQIVEFLKQDDYIFNTYPLSRGQEALYFIHELNPESAAYNTGFAIRILSKLDTEAMQKALQSLIERHASFRTGFARQENGKLVQNVYAYKKVHFKKIDASNWDESELKKEVQKAHEISFDLHKSSFFRAKLFSKSKKEHILLVTIHHTVFDAWSLWMILDELEKLYIAHKKGTEAELPQIKASYADFVSWQTEMLESPKGEEVWNYWKNQLSGELPVLDLPTDYPRPAMQTFNGATHTFELSKELSENIKALAKQQGVTLFMLLLSTYQVLLHRYTSQNDILVSSPTAGRAQKRFANVSGYFVNPVIMRADFSDNPSFKDFLLKTRETVLGAIKHQDYPFINLVENLQIKRDTSRSPIAQTGFLFQQPQNFDKFSKLFAGKQIKWADLNTEIFELAQQEGQEDLQLEILESDDSFICELKYNTDLFKPDTIQRMAGHFETLLQGIVSNPEQKISDLPILTEAEQHKILVEWNDTYEDYPPSYKKDKCIHELFEEQVLKTPDAVAVVFPSAKSDKQLTYAELNEKANQLAHYLQSMGVKPETLVGICVERSLEMIIGLLGILKAGGAYVPLDPEYPKDRLAFMLEDTQASILLTQVKLKNSLPENKAKLICLDTDWETISKESKENIKSRVKADNLAYVIYTSGSKGKPKGTLLTHYNVVRLFMTTESWFHFSKEDVWTLFHSFAFDFSVWELFGALCYGGKLVIIPYLISRSPKDFYKLLQNKQVTVLNQTPSAFRQLIQVEESLPVENNLKLRLIIFGGEALEVEALRPWFERHGDKQPQLVNMYGITETTVHVTYRPLIKKDLNNLNSPIGIAISDLQLYILDKYLQPVPVRISGEMYVRGKGLARGYLNRPELTAEKFIKNPFSKDPDSRLYKTGDLARWLTDGNIEFLGRIDHQVKIRGFRIELGEIETVLSRHEEIKETVVIAREDKPEEKRLVAYIVPAKEKEISISELREFLRKKLPYYMIPSAFVILDALPLTPNGKIDRKALPAPDVDLMREHEFTEPRNETEKAVAEIWKEILGLEKVSIYDNFFELGGTSLISHLLVIELQKKFKVNFPLKEAFVYTTIESIANLLNSGKLDKLNHLINIQPKGDKQPVFLISQGVGVAIGYKYLSSQFDENQPVYGLQPFDEKANFETEFSSIKTLAAKYISAIRSVQPKGPYILDFLYN